MWQLTGKCNLSCKHCLRQRWDKPMLELNDQYTIKLFKEYIDLHRKYNGQFSMTFSGGNPLIKCCFPTLMQMSKEAKDQNLCTYTNILGNTDTIDQKMFNCLITNKLDSFFISMDGIKQHHDKQRGPGNYDHNVYWMPRMAEAGIDVKIKYTLSKLNMHDVPKILDLCLKNGARTFAIGLLNMHDDKIKNYIESIDCTPQEHIEVCKGLVNYIQNQMDPQFQFIKKQIFRFNRTSMVQACQQLNMLDQLQKYINNDDHFKNEMKRHHGNNLIKGVIWEDGSVHAGNRSPSPTIGKFPEQSIQEIYLANKDKDIKRPDKQQERVIPERCQKCNLCKICGHSEKMCCKK